MLENSTLIIDLLLVASITLILISSYINYRLAFTEEIKYVAGYAFILCLILLIANHIGTGPGRELAFIPLVPFLIPIYLCNIKFFSKPKTRVFSGFTLKNALISLPSVLLLLYYFYLLLFESYEHHKYYFFTSIQGLYIGLFGIYALLLKHPLLPTKVKNMLSIFAILFFIAGTFLFLNSQRALDLDVRVDQSPYFINLILYVIYLLIAWSYFMMVIDVMINPTDSMHIMVRKINSEYLAKVNQKELNISIEQSVPTKKSKQKHIPSEVLKKYEQDLNELMAKELYKKNDLTLNELAKILKIPSHHLSKVLNEEIGMSFYAYINQYRIKYAIDYLKNTKQSVNFERLALESGFNSRVSFNRYFKEFTGLTPSEFTHQLSSSKDV